MDLYCEASKTIQPKALVKISYTFNFYRPLQQHPPQQ